MNLDRRYLVVVLFALIALLGVLILSRENRLFTGGKRRLPKQLETAVVEDRAIPDDAQRLLQFLRERLTVLGFEAASATMQLPALATSRYRCLLTPFTHFGESALLLVALEAASDTRSDLMLHIITPLGPKGRVETSTLGALEDVLPPNGVDFQVVLDAESIDEIWSRHRRALTRHPRDDRSEVRPEHWHALAAEAYLAWVQAAVRSQRLRLDRNRDMYTVRRRPKSVL